MDASKCMGCRTCVDFCKYNAPAYIKDKLLIFQEMCHCGGSCILFCLEKALTEKIEIGTIEEGVSANVSLIKAVNRCQSIAYYPESPAGKAIASIWDNMCLNYLGNGMD